MRLFISWSGDLSHRVALHLKEWLPIVLPSVEPWVSSEDIPKGSRWGAELASQLEGTDSGIICLVPGNIDQPWLNFEAGALSKSVQTGRVHPFQLGLDLGKVTGPLGQFQATRFARDDVKKLVRAINSEAGAGASPPERVDRAFEVCWPDLEARLSPLLAEAGAAPAKAEGRTPPSNEPRTGLPTDQGLKILVAIANAENGLQPDDASAILGLHPQHAQHIMEHLEGQGFLVAAHNYVSGTAWHLSKTGRALLVRLALL